MAAFTCCFWWFLFGVLIGWLLNWLLSRLLRKNPPANSSNNNYTAARVVSAPAPVPTPAPPVKPAASTNTRVVDLNAARAAGYNLRHADDLAVIDGIGPKIEELYREQGVTTFAQVAKMSVPELQRLLDAGGPNFKLANPATWAQQAQLIMDNRWGDLKTLHAELAAIAKTGDTNHKL